MLFEGSGEIEARALIVATGVSSRRLEAAGVDEFTGRGVYYGASASEASQCQGDDVYVVGAANSAGQAALNLARFAKRVVLVVRGATLEDTMSQYLGARTMSAPNIEVRYRSKVVACRGDGHLESLTLADRDLVRRHGSRSPCPRPCSVLAAAPCALRPRDERARCVRRRRRPTRFHEAGRLGGR